MPTPTQLPKWLRLLYVPAGTVLLLGAINPFVDKLTFDPLKAAQNPRLSFLVQGGPAASSGVGVVRPIFSPDDPHVRLVSPFPPSSPRRLSILYVSNSQSIAIMDERPGDKLAPVWLSERLNPSTDDSEERFPVRVGSEPNLRISELLVKASLAGSSVDRKVDVLIAGVILDGLRMVDPREDIAQLARVPPARQELESLLAESSDLPEATHLMRDMLRTSQVPGGSGGAQAGPGSKSDQPLAQRTEDWLQTQLDGALPLFRQRSALYGLLITHYVGVRNRTLGVRTDTERPILDTMYRTNLELIEMTLRDLRRSGIHGVFYLAPIRPIEPNPYDPRDIARFRRDLPALCEKYGAVYLDYSGLIPEEMWTNYPDTDLGGGGQRDFAHFTGRAHKTLADRLERDMRPLIDRWLVEKQSRGPSASASAQSAGSIEQVRAPRSHGAS